MARLIRLSILGAMPSGEVWSVNPVFAVGGDFGVPVSATQAQTIATACAAVVVPTGLVVLMNNATSVYGVRVEARAINGTLESQAEALKATPTSGTGTNAHPYQTSVVLSLRTATPGPSGRGRLYWPGTGAQLNTATLRLAATFNTSAASAAKTYLSGLATAIQATVTGVSPVVWSRKTSLLQPVTSIQVGDVLDTQRRRRDTLIESIASIAYP